MRFFLSFLMVLCYSMGILAAIGAGATLDGDNDDRGFFVGVLVALFFVGLGARYAYGLGKLERGYHLFLPRRHWWQ